MEPRPFLETLVPEVSALPDFSAPSLHPKYSENGFYRLSYNESAYGPSPTVVEAIKAHAADIGLYPAMRDDRLREKLATVYQRGFTSQHFFTGCSGYESLELVSRAFFRPGDEIITQPPTFPVYERVSRLHQAKTVNIPLKEPDFSADIDGVLAAITDKTRAIVLCNPNNPTGTITTREQMAHLMANVPPHVLVICDEVYFHYTDNADFPDSMQYILDGRNIVLIHSFSKGYGLAGLRMGYGITPPEIANYVRKHYRGFHLNALQLIAGLTALDDTDHLQKNIDAGVQGRAFWYDHCDRLDLHYWPSQTNFILMELPCPAKDVADAMLERGVMVSAIGSRYPTYLRVSVGTPEANAACVNALEAVLQEVLG